MPQYGYRPYFLTIIPAAAPLKEGTGVAQQDYFTGFIGQMGTQFDAFGHQGKTVRMADGTLKNVYYNGFTQEELTGPQSRRRRPRGARRRAREADHHARHPRSTSPATRACRCSTAATR